MDHQLEVQALRPPHRLSPDRVQHILDWLAAQPQYAELLKRRAAETAANETAAD